MKTCVGTKVKNVLHTYEILRNRQSINANGTRKKFLLELFNQKDWCKNIFQVARQVITEDLTSIDPEYRYDLILLINGLPLVLIELKRKTKKLKDAFTQIKNYAHDFKNLFRFIEILIISNGANTQYFANQKSYERLDNYRFNWAKFENDPIQDLSAFANDFLHPCRLAQIIARYVILHENNKKLLIMKPHQIYAAQRLLKLAEQTNNNGYIWHTTGSGKTLNSIWGLRCFESLA
ncbi:type I restriction endonuclease [Candidatus Phytoplasma luffae]|uniref:type I restriction endonuclease n=1 Tax=Loofah witches'-broom phytoplasma TaxID=35773 RepID=UPI001B37E9AC|nr:type I restriction endonuclease [Candidatus Phytoplasma luffae]